MSTTSTTGAFCETKAPGSTVRRDDEAVHRRGDDRVGDVDAQLLEPRLRLRRLRAGQIERGESRLIARFVVVEGLLRQELAFEEAARALDVGQRQLQVGLALADGRLRDFLRGFRLFHLLLQLEVFDRGDPLTARDAVTQLDVDLLQPAGRARRHRHRRFANQVADNRDLFGDRGAGHRAHFDRHRPTAAPAAAAAARKSTAAREAAAPAREAAASTGKAAAPASTGALSGLTGRLGRRPVEPTGIEGDTRQRYDDNPRHDDKFFHEPENESRSSEESILFATIARSRHHRRRRSHVAGLPPPG